MTPGHETHTLDWRGIAVTVRYRPYVFASVHEIYGSALAHLEIESDSRAPLPITETGYKSAFLPADAVAARGGPASYVRAWLEHGARSEAWREAEAERNQLSLF